MVKGCLSTESVQWVYFIVTIFWVSGSSLWGAICEVADAGIWATPALPRTPCTLWNDNSIRGLRELVTFMGTNSSVKPTPKQNRACSFPWGTTYHCWSQATNGTYANCRERCRKIIRSCLESSVSTSLDPSLRTQAWGALSWMWQWRKPSWDMTALDSLAGTRSDSQKQGNPVLQAFIMSANLCISPHTEQKHFRIPGKVTSA